MNFVNFLCNKFSFLEYILDLQFIIAGGFISSSFLSFYTDKCFDYTDIDCFYLNEMNDMETKLKKLSDFVESLGYYFVVNKPRNNYYAECILTFYGINISNKHEYIYPTKYKVIDGYFLFNSCIEDYDIKLEKNKYGL